MEDFILSYLNDTKIQFDITTIIKISIIAAISVAAIIALTVVYKRIFLKVKKSNDLRKTQIYRIAFRIIRILIIATAVIALLQTVGIYLTGLSAGFGLIIAFLLLAVKDALQDVFAGAMIISDRYFNVGDAVEFEGKDGIVISFTARTTKIELLEDRTVLSVANRHISRIRKLNHLVDIDLPLPYEVDRERVFSVLSGVCEKIKGIDGIENCELKGTQDFGASAVIYKIRFFCAPHDRPDIRRAVIGMIQDELEAENIHIPYQQIDIHER